MGTDLSLLIGVVMLSGLTAALASMCGKGALPRNGAVGIRTRATKSSDEAWDAGHRAAVPLMRRSAWFGLVMAVVTVVLVVVLGPGEDPGWEVVVPIAGFIGVAVGLCLAGVVADRAAKAVGANFRRED